MEQGVGIGITMLAAYDMIWGFSIGSLRACM